MIRNQRKSILPLIVSVVLGAAVLLGSSVRAGSFGISAGFRGGGGGNHHGHSGRHRSLSHGHLGHRRSHSHGHFGRHRFSRRGHSGHGRLHQRSRFGYHRPHYYRGYAGHHGRRGYYSRRYGYSGYYSYGPGYGFSSGYYSGGVPYGYSYGQSYGMSRGVANYPVIVDAPQQNPWILLAQGQVQSARRLFAREAEQFPSRGIPKLGYSLSAALDGDLERAEWAMRRAFIAEPESLGSLSIDPLLMRRLDFVISYYEDNLGSQATDPNAAFMLAALNFIDQDFKRAAKYVDLAIDSGDSNESTLRLKQQLRSAAGS